MDEYEDYEDYDFYYDDWEPDPIDEALQNCGWFDEEKVCLQAGTEYCDWECPLRRMFEEEDEDDLS